MTADILNLGLFEEPGIIDLMRKIDEAPPKSDAAIQSVRDQMLGLTRTAGAQEGSLSNRIIQTTDVSKLTPKQLQSYLKTLSILCRDEGKKPFGELIKTFIQADNITSAKETLKFLLENFYPSKQEIENSLTGILETAQKNNNVQLAIILQQLCKENNYQVRPDSNHPELALTPIQWAAKAGAADLLQGMLADNKEALDAITADGKTALHLAVKSGSIECTEILLTAGANPNIQDREGNSPLHAVSQAAIFQKQAPSVSRELMSLLIINKANHLIQNKAGFIPSKMREAIHSNTSLTRLVSNANGIRDTETQFYEGISPEYPLLKEIADSLSHMPELFPDCSVVDLADVLKSAPTIDRIRKGELTILPAGWKGHAIYLVFCDGYLVICNRGDGSENSPTIEALKINLNQIPENLIDVIKNSANKNTPEEGIHYFYNALPKLLGAKKDNLYADLAVFSNKHQKVGNCSMNAKAALRVAFFFLLQKKDPSNPDNLETSLEYSKASSTLFRLETLSRYLDDGERLKHFQTIDTQKTTDKLPPRDEYLITESLKKLQKREHFKELVKHFPNVQKAIESRKIS